MAQRTHVQLLDDLDISGMTEAAVTVRFSFDGTDYEIDLSKENNLQFVEKMAPYTTHGRKVTGRSSATAPRTRGSRSAASRQENEEVRAWAKAQGIQIGDRGRIPGEIKAQYAAAH